ncbi:MAG: CDP-glucose 4,6-dehydratase [Bermanella sp.]
MINKKFWHGKRVFLTGHTGFKGSWLALWLQDMGAIVRGYALTPPTTPSLFEVASVESGMDSVIGDIRDYDCLYNSIDEFKPEIVIHMAAQPLVRLSYNMPVETYSTNVMGTVNLLDCIRKIGGVKSVVNVTSDKCYDNKEWPWGYREDEPKGGHDPYSSSKGCAELVADAFRKSYFDPQSYDKHNCGVASVRAGNVIGGGDWALDRLIPDMLIAFENKKAVDIRFPHSIRPWQHVLEPLSGYLLTAEKLYQNGAEFSEGWNFGPADDDAKPVQWIAEKLVKIWGEGAAWNLDVNSHPHEACYLKLDCSKAKLRLQWQPRWSLETTLQKIVLWHKAWLSNENMHDYTLNEIKSYIATQSNQ